MSDSTLNRRRQWRGYFTDSGGCPVNDFLAKLTDEEAVNVAAAMKEVRQLGLQAARHLRGEIYEVRAESASRSFRILFATEGRYQQVLLSLSAFVKKTQRTPPKEIALAERRLRDWRTREC